MRADQRSPGERLDAMWDLDQLANSSYWPSIWTGDEYGLVTSELESRKLELMVWSLLEGLKFGGLVSGFVKWLQDSGLWGIGQRIFW